MAHVWIVTSDSHSARPIHAFCNCTNYNDDNDNEEGGEEEGIEPPNLPLPLLRGSSSSSGGGTSAASHRQSGRDRPRPRPRLGFPEPERWRIGSRAVFARAAGTLKQSLVHSFKGAAGAGGRSWDRLLRALMTGKRQGGGRGGRSHYYYCDDYGGDGGGGGGSGGGGADRGFESDSDLDLLLG